MKPEEIQIYKMKVGDKEYRGLIVPTEIRLKYKSDEIKILYEFITLDMVNHLEDLVLSNDDSFYYKPRKFPIIDWNKVSKVED
jgi:hypothetical protein